MLEPERKGIRFDEEPASWLPALLTPGGRLVANDVELLGSCSMICRRGLLPKESARVDACRGVLALRWLVPTSLLKDT